jgi:hypothetical protein
VKDGGGAPLHYVINRTMMRIDLPQPLKPGARVLVQRRVELQHQRAEGAGRPHRATSVRRRQERPVRNRPVVPAHGGLLRRDGWQHKQFLGDGEFTLEFGDYDVELTVPADHIVASTGELQNPDAMCSAPPSASAWPGAHREAAGGHRDPGRSRSGRKGPRTTTKTWHFKAKNVRDFAFASSRKFIWDAQGFKKGDTDVMAMSYYPKEGNPLWEKYSTQAIIHTIEQYNKYSFDYPYPTAISVNGPVGGMEYPMISFNGPRPTKDKKTGELTYSKRTKYGLIGVIIHEVGHNYFPMIVNSDERQWTWMDEGLNSFVQFLAEQAWEENYPARRGEPRNIVDYMKSRNQVPIMTNSESVLQRGQQRLRQAGHRAEHPARDGAGPRAVRLRLPRIRPALEVQAPDPGRLLPHHGRRVRHGPRLVLARLVLHHRRGRRQRRRHQRVHVSTQGSGNREGLEKGAEGCRAGVDHRPAQQGHAAAPRRRASGAEGLLQRARRLHGHQQGPQQVQRRRSTSWKTGKRRC